MVLQLKQVRKGNDLDDTIQTSGKKKTLKKQNELFRQKLKELNEKVEKAIDRTYVKRMLAAKKKTNVDVAHKGRVKDKEIENAQKQIESYKNEIDSLNLRIDEMSQVDIMMEREEAVKENKATILELKKTIHELEKQSKDKGNQLERLTEGDDYNYKIRNLIDEMRMWKEKIRHREEAYEKAGSTVQLQDEHMGTLEKENQDLMSKIQGMNSKIDLSKTTTKDTGLQAKLDSINEEKLKAKDQYETTQTLNSNEIKLEKKEIAKLESNRDQLMTKLKELDQERRISTFKLREVGRILKHNQLKPLSPLKHTGSKGSKRSGTTSRKLGANRGSTTNLHPVKSSKNKPLHDSKDVKTLNKGKNTQSNQILIKKRKMYTKNTNEDSEEEFEKNQVIDYEKFKKIQKNKDGTSLSKLKTRGSKGTFETKTMLK
jgi:hypothetical protein